MTLIEGFWRRAFAGLIDTWIMSLVLGVVLSPLSFLAFFAYSAAAFLHPAIMMPILGATVLGMIAAPAVYYASFESSRWQTTPGKRIFGLKVTDLEGKKPKYWQSFAKTIVQEIFYAIFTVGLLFLVSSSFEGMAVAKNGSVEIVDITPVLAALLLSQLLYAALFIVPWFRERTQTLIDRWTFRAVTSSKERVDVYPDPSIKAGRLGTAAAFWHSPILSISIMLMILAAVQMLFWSSDCFTALPMLSFLQDRRLMWITGGLLSVLAIYGVIGLLQEVFLHIYMQGFNAKNYVKTAGLLSKISVGLKRDLYADFAKGITRAYEGNAAEAYRLIEQWEKRIFVTPMYYATGVFASLLLDDDDHVLSFSQEAIRKLPRQCDYYRVQIAHVYFRRRQFSEGIAILEQLSPPKSKTGVAILQMAFLGCFARAGALDELNKIEASLRSFRKDTITDFIHDYYHGITMAARGEYQKARELLDEASRMVPEGEYMTYVDYSNKSFKIRIRDCRQFMVSTPASEAKPEPEIINRLVRCAQRLGIMQ